MTMPLDRYLSQREFAPYVEFRREYRVNVPAAFNFATDVVDE